MMAGKFAEENNIQNTCSCYIYGGLPSSFLQELTIGTPMETEGVETPDAALLYAHKYPPYLVHFARRTQCGVPGGQQSYRLLWLT